MINFVPIFVMITILALMFVSNVYASPSFSEQKIPSASRYFPEDRFNDRYSEAIMLQGAFYKSHGETFDARLIIYGDSGFNVNNTLSYGMLIDSDSDFGTGQKGFDYRYQIKWENGTWNEIYEEIPTGSVMPKEFFRDEIESPFFKDSVKHGGIKNTV